MKFDRSFYRLQLPILVGVVTVILAVRSSIVEPFRITTRTMLPGLLTGDFLFVNKMEYGLHIPFSESWASEPKIISGRRGPVRGDVIIFTTPEPGQETMHIKRVVGLPGDRIRYENKTLSINGIAVKKTEILPPERDAVFNQPGFDPEDRYDKSKLKLYQESYGDSAAYYVIEDSTFEPQKPLEVKVEQNNYFVLGDNRDDTKDSRNFGVIPFPSVRGKAFVIWLSFRFGFDSKWSFRGNRFGQGIQ